MLRHPDKIAGMAAQNIVDLPPCRPGMADTHPRATNAFRAHWRAHGTAQPQKLVLTRAQAASPPLCRLYGCVPMKGVKPEQGKLKGNQIEVSDAPAGVLGAHDGTEMPLAD